MSEADNDGEGKLKIVQLILDAISIASCLFEGPRANDSRQQRMYRIVIYRTKKMSC